MDKKNNLQSKIYNLKSRAFTLVELMIVVAILGILAAIVIPEFSGHIQQAKEAAAKDNLRLLRQAIERYAHDHNGTSPGYVNGSIANNTIVLQSQFLYCSNVNGDGVALRTKSGIYIYGPYLNKLPKNPFNGKTAFMIINGATNMPSEPTGNNGWVYKPSTKEIRLDYPGNDSSENSYYEY